MQEIIVISIIILAVIFLLYRLIKNGRCDKCYSCSSKKDCDKK